MYLIGSQIVLQCNNGGRVLRETLGLLIRRLRYLTEVLGDPEK